MSIEDPQDVPEVWRPHFARQRIAFTFRDLDRNVEGVALNTIRRALQGVGTPSRRVAAAISEVLGITSDEFMATRAKVTGEEPTTPFTLPTQADQLNRRERDAVLSIVNALLDARDRHVDQPQPADTAAEEPGAQGQAGKDQKTDDLARRRGRDFTTDPMIDQQAAAYVGDEGEVERARREQDEAGEESQDGPPEG